jgi:hypothetical protein
VSFRPVARNGYEGLVRSILEARYLRLLLKEMLEKEADLLVGFR